MCNKLTKMHPKERSWAISSLHPACLSRFVRVSSSLTLLTFCLLLSVDLFSTLTNPAHIASSPAASQLTNYTTLFSLLLISWLLAVPTPAPAFCVASHSSLCPAPGSSFRKSNARMGTSFLLFFLFSSSYTCSPAGCRSPLQSC